MLNEDGRDYILVVWKDPIERNRYVIGQIYKNGRYEFCYGYDIEKAMKKGFDPLIAFNNVNEVYESDILFPAFSSRLPDRRRKDIDKVLKKYGMEEYDAYRLLKRSGGRLPIDTLEFVDPIKPEDKGNILRYVYIAGVRHHSFCDKRGCSENCINLVHLEKGMKLELKLESENKVDPNAVAIYAEDTKIGFIPRYNSEAITKVIKDGRSVECTIEEINKDKYCDECIKVYIEIDKA